MADLRELQALIESTRAERGFTTDPVRMLALLTEEIGEVAGEIKKTWSANYSEMVVDDLANELADAFTLISALASRFDIDLEDAVHAKFFDADSKRTWSTATS